MKEQLEKAIKEFEDKERQKTRDITERRYECPARPCFCTGACRGDKPNKKSWFIDHNTKYEG